MCILTQNFTLPTNCKSQGGVKRVLITTKASFDSATWTVGAANSAQRGQFTAVTGIPAGSWVELELDAAQQNSIETDGTSGKSHTVTATLVRRGLDVINLLAGNDLQKCCQLVMAADYGGYMVLYGVDINIDTLDYAVYAGLELNYSTTTGQNANEDRLFTYVIATPENTGTTTAFIPVASGVATAIKSALI